MPDPTLTKHLDKVLFVYTADPRLRDMLDEAAGWWNRATPGVPLVHVVYSEEEANVVVETTEKRSRYWQGKYRPHGAGWQKFGTGFEGPRPATITLGPNALMQFALDDPVSRRLTERYGEDWAGTGLENNAPREAHVLAHELGHALGLEHPTEIGGIMGGGSIRPDEYEYDRVRDRYGYTVYGSTRKGADAWVRYAKKTMALRQRLENQTLAKLTAMNNTPSEARPTRRVITMPAPQNNTPSEIRPPANPAPKKPSQTEIEARKGRAV